MSTESIIASTDDTTITPDIPQSTPPLVNSFTAFSGYFVGFSFALLAWFTGGVALYALLQRNGMLYWIAYIVWALPVIGIVASVLTGSSAFVWMGVIFFWSNVFLIVEAIRTLLLGYDPGTVARLLMSQDPARPV